MDQPGRGERAQAPDQAEGDVVAQRNGGGVNANRADLIEDALFDRKTAADVREMIGATIESESPSRPATARAAASSGGPTSQERDRLTEVVRKRYAAMSAKS